MNNKQLKAWREREGLSVEDASKALDLAKNTYVNYERGYRSMSKGERIDVIIPRVVALACAAISCGITSYKGEAIDFV